jgi:endonuclease/exonuclease/phosphatase family metal-dependent hydrolase
LGTLTVMTFNLRFDNPKDGPHAWPHRRDAAAALLHARAPDLIGTQEGLAQQLDELQESLPGYAAFGIGRRGPREDEHCRIFYRTASLRLRRSGDFWLSDTPDVVGSISESWGNELPRMATWGEFERVPDGARFTFLNTHLDHDSSIARERGAQQIVRFLRRSDLPHPVILAGDLNDGPDSLPLKLLTGALPVDGSASRLRDAYRLAGGQGAGRPTFHGFTGNGLERIDYVLVEDPLQVTEHTVLDEPVKDRWVSDHFPVLAVVAGV